MKGPSGKGERIGFLDVCGHFGFDIGIVGMGLFVIIIEVAKKHVLTRAFE